MSDLQIFYFTRTGRSQRIAEKIAAAQECTANRITDETDYNGVVGFIKGGAKAAKKDETKISHPEVMPEKDLVLVFPVWAGAFPPAINSFLSKVDREKVVIIPTSLTSKVKDRDGFKKVIDLIGKDIDDKEIVIF